MGDWMTANIVGTMHADDVRALRAVLDRGPGYSWPNWGEPYACLSFSSARPGLAGLGAWPAMTMSRCGNLAERGFTVEDVHKALEALVPLAPSMLLKVHCGGPYESEECIATISVGEGLVVTGKPEQATVNGASEDQMLTHLMTNMLR
jgi:hypothetical protein